MIGMLTKVFCTSDPNLVILPWRDDELSHRQAQNGINFDFEIKFDLEGQGQSSLEIIGILTKVFYTYGPHLVNLAWTGDKLSRGQSSDWRTHRRTHRQTDAGNDNTQRPKLASGKNYRASFYATSNVVPSGNSNRSYSPKTINLSIFRSVWPWNMTDVLEKQ